MQIPAALTGHRLICPKMKVSTETRIRDSPIILTNWSPHERPTMHNRPPMIKLPIQKYMETASTFACTLTGGHATALIPDRVRNR